MTHEKAVCIGADCQWLTKLQSELAALREEKADLLDIIEDLQAYANMTSCQEWKETVERVSKYYQETPDADHD